MTSSTKKQRSKTDGHGRRMAGLSGHAARSAGTSPTGLGPQIDPAVAASPPRVNRPVGLAILVLSLAGFLISFYLTLAHYRHLVPPCYVTSGCESVTTSKYSAVVGIPVSLVGAAFFAVMFYLGIGLLTSPSRSLMRAFELLAYAGVLAALYFFLLQLLVLEAYCSWCLTTEFIALCLLAGNFLLTWSPTRRRAAA